MTTLRDLLPTFEAEVDRLEAETASEAAELMQSVGNEVDGLVEHVGVSVTPLVDAARDELVEGGLGGLVDELNEGVTSMAGVSNTVLERKYLIAELATSKRVLEQIEQDTSAFQG